MSAHNQEIFCNGVFHFDVGKSRKRFTLHKSLVSRVSEPLSALMSNGMEASKKGHATLDYTDEDTFGRLAEWVYSGGYSPAPPSTMPEPDVEPQAEEEEAVPVDEDNDESLPNEAKEDSLAIVEPIPSPPIEEAAESTEWEPAAVPEPEPEPEPAPETAYEELVPEEATVEEAWPQVIDSEAPESAEVVYAEDPPPEDAPSEHASAPSDHDEWYLPPSSKKTKKKKDKRVKPDWSSFADADDHPALTSSVQRIGRFEILIPEIPDPGQDFRYLRYFLSHARLYVLADQMQISELAELAARRLDKALEQFQYFNERAADIVSLVEYVYENTAELKQGDDRLRQAVYENAAEHFGELTSTTVFCDLLEKGGQFVKDVSWKTAKLMSELRSNARSRNAWDRPSQPFGVPTRRAVR